MPEKESKSPSAIQIQNLKGLLQVQESSVVSRVLLKNAGGTVTLFAFGKGEGLSEHTAPFDALVLGVQGDAQIQIAGNQYMLHEGETITMPANQPHAILAVSDFKMLLVMLKA